MRRRILSTARGTGSAPTARPQQQQFVQRRTLVSAPKPGDGPLTERRPDRELPSTVTSSASLHGSETPLTETAGIESTTFRWSRTLPIFAALIALASVAIFNYQKLSSPIVSATLYALRTSDKGRAHLGDEIYFAQQIPWISGEMNQLRGRINISFRVKGTRAGGVMRFASYRPTARGMFETTEWSLTTDDGKVIDLLEDGDPFRGVVGSADLVEDDGEAATRGFRHVKK